MNCKEESSFLKEISKELLLFWRAFCGRRACPSDQRLRLIGLLVATTMLTAAGPPNYQSAARSLDDIILRQYAYLDKLPGGTLPHSQVLDAEREAAVDRNTLLRYAEDRLASLADHHAITGSAFANSWAIVPTYADLWVKKTASTRSTPCAPKAPPPQPASAAAIAWSASAVFKQLMPLRIIGIYSGWM
jgi:hypothetical protein